MDKFSNRLRIACAALAAVSLIPLPAFGQGKKGGGGGGAMHVAEQKSGKVVLEDGTPPPTQVIVEAVCGGTPQPVAVTDSKGGFIIGRGLESDVDAREATVANPMGRSSGGADVRAGCTLRGHLAGYTSSILRVTDDAALDLGTIVLTRPAGVSGNLYSVTSKEAPKAAQKAYEKAKAAVSKSKWDEARPNLQKAVELYPGYAEAWFDLGRSFQAAKDLAQARDAYQKAVQADPKFTKPYVSLSGILYNLRDWKATAEVSSQLLKLDPISFPGVYVLNALSNMQLGNGDAAEASARQAVKVDVNHGFPEAEYALAAILDDRGKTAEVAEHLRAFIQMAPNSPSTPGAKQRLAEIEQAKPAAAPAK